MVAELQTRSSGSAISFPTAVKQALVIEHRNVFDESGQLADVVIRSVKLKSWVPRQDLEQAARMVEASLRPGGFEANMSATKTLLAVARQRSVDPKDARATMEVYGTQIAGFPTDAVEAACDKWMRRSPFWPALSELIEAIEYELRPRRAVLAALKRAIEANEPEPLPQETREERLTNAVRILRKHGREESAAKSEIELAKLQERDPEPWALAVKPKVDRTPTPLFARHSPEMETKLNELAIAARKKLLEGGRS